jgi:TRAP-type C4-dicarboxylate transport system permease small subunit
MIPPSEDWGKLKQDSPMKTIPMWLIATSLSIFSFLVLAMLIAQITDQNKVDNRQACLEVSCL